MLGVIKTGPPTRQIGLSEAYQMSQASEAVYCHCKTTYNTKSFRCYSASKLCSSRRDKHNTQQYSNYRTSPGRSDQEELAQKYSFPTFGDGFNINENELKFLNTYAVGTWYPYLMSFWRRMNCFLKMNPYTLKNTGRS